MITYVKTYFGLFVLPYIPQAWFSNFSSYQNHLQDLLKQCTVSCPPEFLTQSVWDEA